MLASRAFTAVRPTARPAASGRRAVSVVAMAKPTGAKDFSGLSNEELFSKVSGLKRELASTKWVQRTQGVEELKPGSDSMPQPDREKAPKGNLNKHLRRQVAQCMTELRQRQIKDGITRKMALSIEKKAAIGAGAIY